MYYIPAHNVHILHPSTHRTRAYITSQHTTCIYYIPAHSVHILHPSTQRAYITSRHTTRTSISHPGTQHVRAYHIPAHNTYEHITSLHTTRTSISHPCTQHVRAYHIPAHNVHMHSHADHCAFTFSHRNEINSRRYLEGFIIDGLQHLVNVDGLERDTALDVLLHRSFRIYGWKQICGIQYIINIRNSFIV